MVDASALVAILVSERGAEALLDRLLEARHRFSHPISVYEAAQAHARITGIPVESGLRDVDTFMSDTRIGVLPLDPPTTAAALDAFARYGRGRHPAKLNMGDCFSYAVAKLRGVPLLYRGDDFALTDLA